METKETNKTFYEETGKRLKNSSQIKLFSILKDVSTNVTFLNIFKSYIINDDMSSKVLYDSYTVDEEEFWDNISQRVYGIPDIWWIIPMMNEVVNPYEYLEAGKEIFIIKAQYLYQILKKISNIGGI